MTTTISHTAAATTATTATGRAAPRRGMDPMRKVALLGGIAYLMTFAASLPQLKLFANVIDDPARFISTPGGNSAVLWGSSLEVITAAAGVATAVALYPATRRVSRSAAIGFVTSRVVEATLILVGVLSLLSVVTLKTHFVGATGSQADTLGVTGNALVAMRQWTFLLGPGLMSAVNGMFLGYVMYRGRLVPRIIPTVGLIGAPILLLSGFVTIFGGWDQTSTAGMLCGLPIAAWELSLGGWLTVKGFKPASLTSLSTPSAPTQDGVPVA